MIIAHYSSMLKFLGFSNFDVGVFLRFEMFKMLKIAFSIFSTFDEMLVLKKKKKGIEAIIRKILIYQVHQILI